MLNSMRKNGLRLAWFALGCTALVAVTNHLTRTQIAQQSDRRQRCAYARVVGYALVFDGRVEVDAQKYAATFDGEISD